MEVYIGRGSVWGNPYRAVKGQPGATLGKYKRWLWYNIVKGRISRQMLLDLDGATLQCPGCGVGATACHGRVIEAAVAWAKSQKQPAQVETLEQLQAGPEERD